jgi:hypothetical protein
MRLLGKVISSPFLTAKRTGCYFLRVIAIVLPSVYPPVSDTIIFQYIAREKKKQTASSINQICLDNFTNSIYIDFQTIKCTRPRPERKIRVRRT